MQSKLSFKFLGHRKRGLSVAELREHFTNIPKKSTKARASANEEVSETKM